MGYKSKSVNGVYSQTLEKILQGKIKLSKPMRLRIKLRKRQQEKRKAQQTLGQRMLIAARKEIGTVERPAGSNIVKYSTWYGLIGPWCAMFCSWVADQCGAGSKFHYAYVPSVVADARAGRNGLYVVRDPKPGDLVCYDWERNGVADHIGIYEKKTGAGTFTAIEGNTAVGNDSNGGEVMRRDRNVSSVAAFVRIKV